MKLDSVTKDIDSELNDLEILTYLDIRSEEYTQEMVKYFERIKKTGKVTLRKLERSHKRMLHKLVRLSNEA